MAMAGKYSSRLVLLLATLLFPVLALAQSYPAKPVRMMIPFPPGGSNDVVGRYIAAELGTRLKTAVVVENMGGAGGLIGTDVAAKSAPDGHTILLVSIAFAFNPSMYKLPYDPAAAFIPVA